ncbi:hypothetical protein A33K_13361 [Burkholderia humptydooensis MSMB43]|uniref:Uncharacterized protein n=1 Tax=Burkholderia humptydooensis MSMB43 TaxID=441157 RepID=A0ABN0GC21_9BURK|nr:hypothetical protein A33K_13361 [Burkholderia humptydooensis MSMB43]
MSSDNKPLASRVRTAADYRGGPAMSAARRAARAGPRIRIRARRDPRDRAVSRAVGGGRRDRRRRGRLRAERSRCPSLPDRRHRLRRDALRDGRARHG